MAQSKSFDQSKLEQYLPREESNSHIRNQSRENATPQREPIKHILRGSPKAVISTIHHLQIIGYASVGDWSPLLPTTDSDEVMSILIRHIVMQ
ncbi:MAG: hypothetical protein ACRAVC_16000 [Trichormus sp.]